MKFTKSDATKCRGCGGHNDMHYKQNSKWQFAICVWCRWVFQNKRDPRWRCTECLAKFWPLNGIGHTCSLECADKKVKRDSHGDSTWHPAWYKPGRNLSRISCGPGHPCSRCGKPAAYWCHRLPLCIKCLSLAFNVISHGRPTYWPSPYLQAAAMRNAIRDAYWTRYVRAGWFRRLRRRIRKWRNPI